MDLTIKVKEVGERTALLELQGVMDIYTSPQVKGHVVELMKRGNRYLIFKMRAVRYIDSTGLAILIGALKRTRERGGNVSLLSPHPRVVKVLEIIDLVDTFCLSRNIKDARELVRVKRKR